MSYVISYAVEQIFDDLPLKNFSEAKSSELIYMEETMKTLVRIQKNVPLTIFDEPVLAEKVANLFNGAEEKIKARFNEIIIFLESDSTDELSYSNITFIFKVYFYKMILNEAVEMTFSKQGKYDILSNILSLLTEEKLETAIMGEPMIDAFSNAIRSITTTSVLSKALNGSKILLLEKTFQGKCIFPTFKKEQNNCCDSCGCSCTCDGGCNGDIKKCTSKEALEKSCTHHCACYLIPIVENFPK